MGASAVLGVDRGAFFYGATRVFEDVSFQLDSAKTALVGENGAGKSTLLKCLTGELTLTSGKVVRSRGVHVGYVPQEIPPHFPAQTLRAVLESALPVQDGSEDWKVDVLLDDLSISAETAAAPFGRLSGGWQRLMLIAAQARLTEPNLLILDEPTNHLDIANINTLERWLMDDLDMPMLIVSHDREFLDRMTERTIFLRGDGAHAFRVPFAQAREELIRRDVAAAKQRALEEKEIARLERMVQRYKAWGVLNSDFHKKQKSTEKRIARLEAARTQTYRQRVRRLDLAEGEIEAKTALRIEKFDVMVPGGGRKLFTIDKLALAKGDRAVILGVNGAGKSTLLTALRDAFSKSGAHYDGQAPVRFNPGIDLVYFDQRMQALPLDQTLIGYLSDSQKLDTGMVALLAKAGFPFGRIQSKIAELSFGERARLMFLKLRLMRPNFYLLDEPTNHLDIEGQEDLEGQLEEADVSCVFVSHDRFFTRAAANRFFEIRKGKLIEVDSAEDFYDAQAADQAA